jgi:uncharacterized protein (TIGR03067 family)
MRSVSSAILFCGIFAVMGCGKKDQAGAPPPSDKQSPSKSPSPPPGPLDGSYSLEKMYMFAEWVPEKEFKDDAGLPLVVTFKGDTMTDNLFGKEKTAHVRIDPSKSPNQIDIHDPKGGGKDADSWLGIYKVEGNRLTIRVQEKTRPKDFEPNKGSMILVLKRK